MPAPFTPPGAGFPREHVFVRETYHDALLYGLLHDEWEPVFESHQ